jgi:hypothetical protein
LRDTSCGAAVAAVELWRQRNQPDFEDHTAVLAAIGQSFNVRRGQGSLRIDREGIFLL